MNTMEQTQAEAEIEYYQERFKTDYEKAKAIFIEAAQLDPMNAFVWKGQALLEAQALYETAKAEGFYDDDFCQEKASKPEVFWKQTGSFFKILKPTKKPRNPHEYEPRGMSKLLEKHSQTSCRNILVFISLNNFNF